MARKDDHHEGVIIKKVSRRSEHGGHGGAWKVAFADFVLALMCLFMVLWVLAARDQENLEKVLNSGGSTMTAEGGSARLDHAGNPKGSLIPREPIPGQPQAENNPQSQVKNSSHPSALNQSGAGSRQRVDSDAAMQRLARMMTTLAVKAGLAGNVQSVVTPYGLRILLHDTEQQGMFERGSAGINERFRLLLVNMGAMFQGIENQLLIVGHTDSSQYRSQQYAAFSNWTLSSNRAMTARAHLLQGGLPQDSILQVVGMADRAPLDRAHPEAASNRRIEMLVLTTEQAHQVSSMFGIPGRTEVLMPGVKAEQPTASPLQVLKSNLVVTH
ncbi:flagellar motor protein MotB [Craterilacuibacter sp.]|uniref:flagellar motor protein MotB n=1 Tax=Craterilacuibacter sp. TaxID=2870909 RepID=UPI003F2F8481